MKRESLAQVQAERDVLRRELDMMHIALADAMLGTLTHAGRFTADGTKVFVWLCGAKRADGGTLLERQIVDGQKAMFRVMPLERTVDHLRNSDGSNPYVREMRNVCQNATIVRNRMLQEEHETVTA